MDQLNCETVLFVMEIYTFEEDMLTSQKIECEFKNAI